MLSGTLIGIIGTGNLGAALVEGWSRLDEPPRRLVIYDKDTRRATALAKLFGPFVEEAATLEDVAERALVVVVAVKPEDVSDVMERLGALTGKGHTVICTAAGVSLGRLRSALGSGPALYRIMPNLAIALGEGLVALASEEGTPPEHAELVKSLFEGLGTVEGVPEALINAFTSISGAGPAFLALAMEGLEDGAVRSGVARPVARRVLKQMMMGTASLFMAGDLTFTELKERVASPGGTTIAGLAILEERGVRGAMLRAIEASTQRGAEL